MLDAVLLSAAESAGCSSVFHCWVVRGAGTGAAGLFVILFRCQRARPGPYAGSVTALCYRMRASATCLGKACKIADHLNFGKIKEFFFR